MFQILSAKAFLEQTNQLLPGSVRNAQSKFIDLRRCDASARKIVSRFGAGGAIQVGLERARGKLVHLGQDAAQLRFRIRVFALRHSDAIALGEQLQRLDKADALDLLDELEDIAS